MADGFFRRVNYRIEIQRSERKMILIQSTFVGNAHLCVFRFEHVREIVAIFTANYSRFAFL